MELEEGKASIDRAISQQQLCLIVGHCQVRYSGRAASKLSEGDRLLVIKPDGTFLVHQNAKMAAINYQGPGGLISTAMAGVLEIDGNTRKEAQGIKTEDAKPKRKNKTAPDQLTTKGPLGKKDDNKIVLIVKAMRKKPIEEIIEVSFDSLAFAQGFPMQDDSTLKLFGSERQLADLLEQDLDLIEKGLRPLQTESHFNKGAIDILAQDSQGRLVAIELKRRNAGLDAVTQLVRYVKQLSQRKGAKVRGLLCAPEITPNARTMLEQEGLEYFKLDYEITHPNMNTNATGQSGTTAHMDATTEIKGLQKKQKMLGEY
ncbi:endonuclease NucS [Candidatus Micrarchaeota archaeon]|nr:endonuclease NucS [Candidatus Micrarchaeota archaeon]